jgi:hypothetical protein
LSERLKREIEEKGVLPDSQAGFRKGRGTVDNVYILDHLARNELRKKGGRMNALFIDFKAAFDKVDRVKIRFQFHFRFSFVSFAVSLEFSL